jgi:tetratricopeptide (TPR) repeat protein
MAMKKFFILLVLLLLPILAIQAQHLQGGTEMASEIVRAAYEMTLQGDFEQSLELLSGSLDRCGIYADSATCRAIVYFNVGFLHEQRFQSDSNPAWLDAALENYDGILTYFPRDKKALEKIAEILLLKNEPIQALRTIERLLEIYPNEQYRYRLMASQGQALSGNTNASMFEVQKAIDINPFKEEGWRHLIDIYSKDGRYQTLNDVVDYAYTCSGYGYPTLALEVLQNHITRYYHQPDAEIALVHWANLLLDNNIFTANRLNFLPTVEQWPSQALIQLRDLFHIDTITDLSEWNAARASFWNSTREINTGNSRFRIYEVLAKTMKNFGDINRIKNNVARAGEFYVMGIGIINNHFSNDDIPVAYFETAGALADLLYFNPHLDPDNSIFKKLTLELFTGKNSAYSMENINMIKRYHITLGMIYAQKGIWRSNGADNALFQLEHALELKGEDEFLPYVYSLLADSYINHLGQKSKGVSMLLKSVEGYLMVDDTKRAAEKLQLLEGMRGQLSSRNQHLQFQDYKEVLEIKDQLPNFFSGENRRIFDRQVLELERKMDQLNLDGKFKDFQKFKIFSSIGNQVSGENSTYQKIKVYQKALEALRNHGQLTSFNDLANLQQIKSFFTEEITFANQEIIEIGKGNLENIKSGPEGQKRHYSLVIDESNVYNVSINNDLFEAGELAGYFIRASRRDIPRIVIGDNHVIISEERTTGRRKTQIENDVKDIVQEKKILVR